MARTAGARREAVPYPGAQLPGTAPRGLAAAPPPRSGAASSTPARRRFACGPCLWVWGLSPRVRWGGSKAEGTGMEELLGGRRCRGKTPRACALRGLAIRAQAPERRLGRRDSLRRSTRGARLGTQGLALGPALPGRRWVPLHSQTRPAPRPPLHSPIPATACPPGSPRKDPHGDTAPRLHPEPTPPVHFQVTRQEGSVLPADGPRPVVIETLWRGGEEAR